MVGNSGSDEARTVTWAPRPCGASGATGRQICRAGLCRCAVPCATV